MAEVLIALVVIGIIAAITLTTVMPNIQERVNSQRQANIVYKVTQATNLMKANGAMINGFESTDAFVDELQKYLKIMKRCDSEHIADCWPTKKVRTSKGKEFEVSNAKERMNLGFNDDFKNNKNVGIVLADGACIIVTYNPETAGIPVGAPITAMTTELPFGGKFQTFLDYTSNTTGGLAFVMDVNGSKGPNSEAINNRKYDIRSFNSAQFSQGCAGAQINGKCYTISDSTAGFNCADNPTNKFCSQKNCTGLSSTRYSSDKWVGAQIYCESIGAHLPTESDMYNVFHNEEILSKLGISKNYSAGQFWLSSLVCSSLHAQDADIYYYAGRTYTYREDWQIKTFCISD